MSIRRQTVHGPDIRRSTYSRNGTTGFFTLVAVEFYGPKAAAGIIDAEEAHDWHPFRCLNRLTHREAIRAAAIFHDNAPDGRWQYE